MQHFNYRRYPVVMLAAGGIGITPALGMLKDMYDFNLPASEQKTLPHCMQTVYFLWIMPKMENYEVFAQELESIKAIAREPGRPEFVPLIYITKAEEALAAPFASGRPNIAKHFADMMDAHANKASLVYACGPSPLIAEMWDHAIQATMKGRRVDFYHEVFNL